MNKYLFLFCVVLIGFLSILMYRLNEGGTFKRIENKKSEKYGNCKKIYGNLGSEDFAYVTKHNLVLLSSVDRRSMLEPELARGNILGYFIDEEKIENIKLVNYESEEFHPHGLSIYETEEENYLLFVVNHFTNEGDSVEIFEYNPEERVLEHIKTIRDELFVSLNDIVAVDVDKFYVTNDHGNKRKEGFKVFIEDFFTFLSRSSVIFYDGERNIAKKVIKDGEVKMANGINVSYDRSRLYVSETTGGSVSIWNIDGNYDLNFRERIHLDTGVDNIEMKYDRTNQIESLIIGCHPSLIGFLGHALFEALGPSEVIKIDLKINNNNYSVIEIDQLFMSDGEDLSASSVGGIYNNHLFIGPVFDDHFLICSS
eukprot:TRINITY_DN680_c1_g1_i1.p1 TRINITY_DN680_c1_g1~~TRINITY_DN680_c1_g1_i1.p1  ORF type:complete len:376 (-),score=88.46 TRINITY_DN680_c1_g1_i1:71-1177(-)